MQLKLGATYLGDARSRFLVWAPRAKKVDVHLIGTDLQRPYVPMEQKGSGYYQAIVEGVRPGSLYLYRLDGDKERPDPASRFQPQDVHGPSQVVDPNFIWRDQSWFGLPLQDFVLYELHVGTFTQQGTFDAVIPHLTELKELGITAIELMPVAQFPGNRNWGYDGVFPFAPQNSYGGPEGLKRLVEACHEQSLAIVLDVVYNHIGPEGNYLAEFGHYFTNRYRTPWGDGINFDGAHSDDVRRFFIENALYWITQFHFDALRLDAVHAIVDRTARPFLQELAEAVHHRAEQLNRRIYLIPESSLNDARLIQPRELGGYELDAQWNDDFHHSLHTLLTGERTGYYEDFGKLDDMVKSYRQGYVYTGQYSVYRQRRHGNSCSEVPACRFVVYAQNHDQVGNRRLGERLSQLVSFEELKLAAGVVLLSPYVPLLFMGEEYGETAPFLYFISHSDPDLVEAVRHGRSAEFKAFAWQGEVPDPQAEDTFERSKLKRELREGKNHIALLDFYRGLIRLRKTNATLASLSKEDMEVSGLEKQKLLCLRRWSGNDQILSVFHFGHDQISFGLPVPPGRWVKLLDSSEKHWLGTGSLVPREVDSLGEVLLTLNPKTVAVFGKSDEGER
jgi:maltooligosyltrehalose trehalohydrolase